MIKSAVPPDHPQVGLSTDAFASGNEEEEEDHRPCGGGNADDTQAQVLEEGRTTTNGSSEENENENEDSLQLQHHPVHTVAFDGEDDEGASFCTGISSITNRHPEDLMGAQLYPNAFALLQHQEEEDDRMMMQEQEDEEKRTTACNPKYSRTIASVTATSKTDACGADPPASSAKEVGVVSLEVQEDQFGNQETTTTKRSLVSSSSPDSDQQQQQQHPQSHPPHSELQHLAQQMQLPQPLPSNPTSAPLPRESAVGAFSVEGIGRAQPPVSNHNNTDEANDDGFLAEATLVANEDQHIAEAKPLHGQFIIVSPRRIGFCVLGLLVVCCIVIGVVVGVVKKENNNESLLDKTNSTSKEEDPSILPQRPNKPTLQRIQEEGVLRCGVAPPAIAQAFHLEDDVNKWLDTVLCKAVASAAMGQDNYKVELVPHDFPQRAEMLASGQVDLLVNWYSYTMDRDIYIPSVDTGLSFVTPYFYLTSNFWGWRHFVECAQQDPPDKEDCQDLHVCVLNGTRYYDLLRYTLSKNQITIMASTDDIIQGFRMGECNVQVDPMSSLPETYKGLIEMQNFEASFVEENFVVGRIFSFEPLALAMREDDVQWRDFVFWVFQALLAADSHGITQNSSTITTAATPSWASSQASPSSKAGLSFATTNVFGEGTRHMLQDAVAAAGPLGDMLKLVALPRNIIDQVNNGTTGILKALPLGLTELGGPAPHPDGTLASILQRGHLQCAVRSDRLGFAERHFDNTTNGFVWSGMDVDYCRAVHAAIFAASGAEKLELLEVMDDEEGFKMLHDGDVDVFAGVMVTMERDVLEPSTGTGFSFTRPYYYNVTAILADDSPSAVDLNLCLATREDDVQWSKFVFWILEATVFAEENGVTEVTSNEMPTVGLFGDDFQRMFRDAMFVTGNYGEIYDRNLEAHVPRSGLNLLFDNANPGPLHFPMPGLFN